MVTEPGPGKLYKPFWGSISKSKTRLAGQEKQDSVGSCFRHADLPIVGSFVILGPILGLSFVKQCRETEKKKRVLVMVGSPADQHFQHANLACVNSSIRCSDQSIGVVRISCHVN